MKAKDPVAENGKNPLKTFNWNNKPVYYRSGTSDRGLIYNILIRKGKKAEYYIPDEVNPAVILDIGANIGITAIWMAHMFPNARIYCFEPMRENFDILSKNTIPYKNIHAFNYGLGKESGKYDIYANEELSNRGGFSLYHLEHDTVNYGTLNTATTRIDIKNASESLSGLRITKVDIIKIDTEGAEFDILTSLPEEILSGSQWIMGELHGINNFETLTLIDRWYSIGLKKKLKSNLFQFFGINKSLL